MIDSLIYGIVASSFVIGITRSVLLLYKRFPRLGFGLIYGSLGVKMFALGAFTLLAKPYIDNIVIYASIILSAIIYSNVYVLLKLHGK
jgi:hypothetical protein